MTRRFPLFLLALALASDAGAVPAQGEKPVRRFIYTGETDFAPFDYLDEKGQPTGFNVDLIRAIARDAGVEVEIRLIDWNQARADLDAGRADLIGLAYSEERAQKYLWLARTWTMHQCLLYRRPAAPHPDGLDGLAGERIAVQERSAVAELLEAMKPPRPTIITTSTQAEALRLFEDGTATGVGGVSLTLRVAAERLGIQGLVELPLRTVPYGFMGAKGRAAELSWVSSSLNRLREAGTLDALAERYLVRLAPERSRSWWSYRYWFLSILLVILLAAFGAVAWNRTLVARVRARTQEMGQALARGETLMRSLSANEERFQAFMNLSSEGIARAEVSPPLRIDLPEAEQVAHILASTRLVECNRAFAQMLHRAEPTELAGTGISELVPENELDFGVPGFIRGGYRLANIETRRERRDGTVRWGSSNVVGVVEGGLLKAIWLTQRDITVRKNIEEDLRVRGRILEAVAFSSARLLAPGEWEDDVADVLARLGEAVGAGCAYLCRTESSPTGALFSVLKHEWATKGVPPLSAEPMFRRFEWPEFGPVRLLLEKGETVQARTQDLPPEAQEFLSRMRLKSLLIVPIFEEDRWWGLLGFGDFETERKWSEAEIEALKIAGAAIGAALFREQVEEAVHTSEKKHRDIVAFAPAGIYQTTREGTLVMANLEFARLLGYERTEEVIGLNFGRDIYFNPAEREKLIAEYVAIGQATRVEVRLLRRDGSSFWAELSAHAIKDAADKVLFFEGFIQDITARKAAETERERFGLALERAAEEWHRTFDAVDVAILVLDWTGRLTRINRHALDMLGLEDIEVMGRAVRELDDREPWRSANRMVESVVQTRERALTRAVDSEAGRTWELTAYLAKAGKGGEDRIILMIRDISRLVELQESLRHSETMSAMGSLVAGVAHEVRNPLFSISATVDALESELGAQQEYAELTGLLRSQVSRLRQLMRDLLDYGKPPVLRTTPVHAREILRRAARACAVLVREREVTIVEEVDDALPPINVDSSRLEQVFQNLLANAIQHSARDTTVRVIARVRPEDQSPEFLVEDSGTGIQADEVSHLFEPFFSRRKGGTGLGLSVVQRIVEAHGGRVSACNREGGGAVFTVRLPASVIEKTREKTEEAHG